eukprot:6177436-Pleurochrysis_carterae.AAC.3
MIWINLVHLAVERRVDPRKSFGARAQQWIKVHKGVGRCDDASDEVRPTPSIPGYLSCDMSM